MVADAAERDITFENESVRAVFTTRGGALKSWRLKKYQDANREPLELVPHTVPAGTLRPFTLSVPDGSVSATLAQALFKPSAESVHPGAAPATLTFDYQDASGLSAHKEFLFDPASPYVIDFSANVTQAGKPLVPTVEWGPGIGSGVVASTRTYSPPPQPIFYRDGTVSRIKETKIQENAVQEGMLGFAGVDDHYFLAATIPGGRPVHVQFRGLQVPLPEPPATTAHFIDWSVRYDAAPSKARFFVGPKDFDVLAAVDRDLVRSIDFGMFALARGAAAARAQVGGQLRRQLRLVDHHPHDPHQPGDVPAASQERGLDAPDAGHPAGSEGHPGSLREPEDDRPGEAEDEHRAHEPVS